MKFWDHLARLKDLAGELIIVGLGLTVAARTELHGCGVAHPADSPRLVQRTATAPTIATGEPVSSRQRDIGQRSTPTIPSPAEEPVVLSALPQNEANKAEDSTPPVVPDEPESPPRAARDQADQQGGATIDVPVLTPDVGPSPVRQPRPASFGEALHLFWDKRYPEAIAKLELALAAAPDDAACLYFLALAYHRTEEPSLANEMLKRAADLEAERPVADWGRLMERVQGKQRLWLEEAHRRARTQVTQR